MPPLTARETVQRLIAREQDAGGAESVGDVASGGDATSEPVAAVERAARRLCDALVGWFGPFATHALLGRALAHARAEHPALTGVRVGTPTAPSLEGAASSVDSHGAPDAVAGVVDVLAWVVELLGRLIGDDLTRALVEQSVHDRSEAPRPSGGPAAGEATEGGAAGGGIRGTGETTGSTTDD